MGNLLAGNLLKWVIQWQIQMEGGETMALLVTGRIQGPSWPSVDSSAPKEHILAFGGTLWLLRVSFRLQKIHYSYTQKKDKLHKNCPFQFEGAL